MAGGINFVPEYIYYHWNNNTSNTTAYNAGVDGAVAPTRLKEHVFAVVDHPPGNRLADLDLVDSRGQRFTIENGVDPAAHRTGQELILETGKKDRPSVGANGRNNWLSVNL